MWEDLVQWRVRMGQELPTALVLISNPTNAVWCGHLGGPAGQPSQPTTMNTTYNTAFSTSMCEPLNATAPEPGLANYFLPDGGQAVSDAALVAWKRSPNIWGSAWLEENHALQSVGNCPPKRNLTSWDYAHGVPMPHIHWTAEEAAALATLPTLIVYAKTTSSPEGYVESWPYMQDELREMCARQAGCSLMHVDIEPWTHTAWLRNTPAAEASSVTYWGHWVASDAPLPFRAALIAWMSTEGLSSERWQWKQLSNSSRLFGRQRAQRAFRRRGASGEGQLSPSDDTR